MKISYNWLNKLIASNCSAETIATMLTECGLEVESMETHESIKGGLKGLVIGKVETCQKHPNADKLSLTTVNVGDKVLNIVCGAPNVEAGQTVVVATEGATLYPNAGEPFVIKKSKIRGEPSEGMICAEDEIGLGTSHAGIIVIDEEIAPGMSAADYFKIETDVIFEIGLTPNRADAASHFGVARDIQALLANTAQAKIVLPEVVNFVTDNRNLPIEVEVVDTADCIRYSGISISNIKVGPSPTWLQQALHSIGVKSINNVVDTTNYILHDIGQPLHAFDAAAIKGNKIIVKRLNTATKFTTLDGIERALTGSELMICNQSEPMCIAGIFGGLTSGVSENTTSIFLESACFNPVTIRKGAKHHGLKTDASFRFERGTDPEITCYALQRAAMMIKELAGGTISSDIIDIYPNVVEPVVIHFSFAQLEKMAGYKIEKTVVKNILIALGINILEDYHEGLKISIPAYKVDVRREIDVIEEVLRITGYNAIPLPSQFSFSLDSAANPSPYTNTVAIAQVLASNGFNETLNNSLSKESYYETYTDTVKLINPLSSELNTLRTEMIFSLLECAQYNTNRQQSDLKLFEFGFTYRKAEKKYSESSVLGIFCTGNRIAENRKGHYIQYDLYYIKSLAEQIFQIYNIANYKETEYNGTFLTGDAIAYTLKDRKTKSEMTIAYGGKINKALARKFDLSVDSYYLQINLDLLITMSAAQDFRIAPVPRFPEVKRDLSMILDNSVTYSQIQQLAFETERNFLKRVNLFDVYKGDKIPQGKKSYAMSFYLADTERTMREQDIDKTMNKLMESFEKKLNVEVRKS